MRRSRISAAALALAACGGARPVAPAPARCTAADDAIIASQADVARLAACPALHSLTIRSGGSLDTAGLRQLAALTGDLTIGPTVGVEDITLALRSVGGAIHIVGNGLAQGVFLRQLEHAGAITIDGNPALTTIALPRLADVHGALRVTDNASLELLDLDALTQAGALVVVDDPRLSLLDAPALSRAGQVEVEPAHLPADVVAALHALAPATPPAP